MIWWVFWCEFWAVLLRQEPRRTARIYWLDDYRPHNDNNTPNGRAA